MQHRVLFFIAAMIALSSCTPTSSPSGTAVSTATWETLPLDQATNFTVQKRGSYTLLSIQAAWKDAAPSFQYLLYPKGTTPPVDHPEAIRIPVPLERVLCSGTVDVAFLEALGATDRIVGMSGGQYLYNPKVKQGLKKGTIANLGQHQALDYERAVALQPDAALVYSIGDQGVYQKYQTLGIPAVLLSDFMEKTPLGRAEWMVFVGYLLGKEEAARAAYQTIAQRYQEARQRATYRSYRPSVLTGVVYQGTWYIAGGQSLMAQFIQDAGGHYLWGDNQEVSGVPLDFEAVYSKALQADVWINQASYATRTGLLEAEARYGDFKAVQTGQLYNYNKRTTAGGGSDFFESAIVRPDRVLEDLMQIFRLPSLDSISTDSLYYYAPLR